MKKTAILVLSLLQLGMSFAQVRLDFNPAINGFHFENRFRSHSGAINTDGLCGGMCLAAFNFYRYGVKIPVHKNEDMDFDVNFDLSLNTSGTDALTDYIFQSQLATFTNISAVSFAGSFKPVYADEFNKVKTMINNKQYVILGIKALEGQGAGHQVLCFGYDPNGSKLIVYDPNHADKETVIKLDPGGRSICFQATGETEEHYQSLFVAQELYKEKISDRTTYDMVDNVLRNLNYAVRPPAVAPPNPRSGFGFAKPTARVNYEADLPPNSVYTFKNDLNQKFVEVEDGAITKGTKVQQYFGYKRNGLVDGHNQEWLIIPAGTRGVEQVFYIINNGFLKYLHAGTGVTVQEGNAAENNQLWFIQPAGGPNKYFLKSVSTGTYLEMPSSNADGQALRLAAFTGQPAQQFTFIQYVGLTGLPSNITGYMTISPAFNGSKAINAPGESATVNNLPVVLSPLANGNTKQQFQFVRDNAGYYTIKSRISDSRKCLEVMNASTDNNAAAECWDCAGVTSQKWIVIPVVRESGKYIFFNRNSGRVLYSSGNEANPVQNKYINQDNYKWFIKQAR